MAGPPNSVRCTEDDLLALAIRRGYITNEQLEQFQTVIVAGQPEVEASSGAIGPRIVHLLQSGSLDESQLGALLDELGISREDQATIVQGPKDSKPAPPLPDGDPDMRPGPLLPGSRVAHFRIERLLGRGGMGTVYLARDETLERPVALKFLHGDSPDQERKFLREARAQARIDHPHVCKVYEVGETGGKPYIAMQFIEGRTLQDLSRDLPLEEKVALMARVAEALHAAHERGLIHRDLKPANIMVQDGVEGLTPFVLDFGLSREIEAPDLSRSGLIAGTPTYMAPEQASGRGADLDRRTDVYGLGATLYDLIAGGPPFQGNSTVDILMKVIREDPVPLGRRRPRIPADLETITMKCLEKDASRRYGSAKALAEDLRRYLNGEPILARKASSAERAWKWLRRRPAVASTLGILLVALAVLGAFALWSGHANRTRRSYDQAFDREVAFVEETLRFAFTSPLHDIGPEREKVLKRLADLESRIRDGSRLAKPAGTYALGRGHLGLRNWKRALEYLRKAWDLGNRRPEAAYALGRALGEVYFEELSRLGTIRDKELREKRRKELEVEYRLPAIDYLNLSRGMDIASPALVEGLILYNEKRLPQALVKAEEAIGAVPWLYEAQSLKGRILKAMAEKALSEGNAPAGIKMMQDAMDATQAAATTAPSDPGPLLDLCRLKVERLQYPAWTGAGDLDRLLGEITDACGKAMTADPQSPDPSYLLAKAWRARATIEVGRGLDPAGSLEQAESNARRSLQVQPGNLMSRLELSAILQIKEERAIMVGGDRAALIDASIALLEQILVDSPGYKSALFEIGSAYLRKARLLRDKGEDPSDLLARAVDAYTRRLETDPEHERALHNLGLTYEELAKARMDRKLDPTRALDDALRTYEKVAVINPANIVVRQNIGTVYRLKAEHAISASIDPLPMLQKSIESLERAAALGPSNQYLFNSLGNTQLFLANHRVTVGQDPVPDLRNAIESYRRELKNNPTFIFAFNNIGEAYVQWARYEMANGRDPLDLLESAKAALNESLNLNAKRAVPYLVLGSVHGVEAEYLSQRGRNPDPAVETAVRFFDKGLAINPAMLQAYVDASKILAHSIAHASDTGRSPARHLAEALRLLDSAIERNDRYAEALLWRAKIRLMAAPKGKSVSDPAVIAEDLRKAEALDPALSGEISRLRQELGGPP